MFQIAKHYGADVTGVCSTRNIQMVKSLGADSVIDYLTTDISKTEVYYDIIFDAVGKLSKTIAKFSIRVSVRNPYIKVAFEL